MHTHKMVIFSLLFSFILYSMDTPTSLSFPKEVINYSMARGGLQVMGRYGQTSHENNKWYRNYVVCKNPHNNECTSLMCRTLSNHDWFDNGTQALVFYAKEYEKDHNNQHAFDMFKHLWRHHEAIRSGAVKNVCEKENITLGDRITIYAGKYAQEELGNLLHINTALASGMKRAVVKENSLKLKRFLIAEAIYSVKTMLLADNLLFDPSWSGHKYDRDKYNFDFYRKKDSVIDCACILGDITIINQLVKSSNCFRSAIASMMQYYKIDLLDTFIKKNLEVALKGRFFIWNEALRKRQAWQNGPCHNQAQQLKIFEKIIALLFPGEINAEQDGYGTLLDRAIFEENELGVEFLLEQGADPNVQGSIERTPLSFAHENSAITSLLIKYHADVNQPNCGGMTPLMGLVCYRWNKEVKKVFVSLIEAGANVNAVDDLNKSVLHYYAKKSYGALSSDHRKAKRISMLIQHGALIDVKDNEGRTPFDYAQECDHEQTMELLRIVEEEDNETIEYRSIANTLIE